MTTILFFDDLRLNRRDNLTRRIGKPRLLPESVYRDPVYETHWAYPGVFFDAGSGVWRMTCQGFPPAGESGRRVALLGESADGMHWRPRDTGGARHPRAGRRQPDPAAGGVRRVAGLLRGSAGGLGGSVRVQVTDSSGEALSGFAFEDTVPFSGDCRAWVPSWQDGRCLSELPPRTLRLEVELTNGRLYAIRGDVVPLTGGECWRFEQNDELPVPRAGF